MRSLIFSAFRHKFPLLHAAEIVWRALERERNLGGEIISHNCKYGGSKVPWYLHHLPVRNYSEH